MEDAIHFIGLLNNNKLKFYLDNHKWAYKLRVGLTPEFPEGIYYYMVTDDFPFFFKTFERKLINIFSSVNWLDFIIYLELI